MLGEIANIVTILVGAFALHQVYKEKSNGSGDPRGNEKQDSDEGASREETDEDEK